VFTLTASRCEAIELVHWTFDTVIDTEGVLTTPDSSGRGNTGTLTSMDIASPVPGRVGNALQFSGGTSAGTRDRVEIPTADVNVTTDFNRTYTAFTFAAFVKPMGLAVDDADTTWIAGKLGTSNTRGWQIGLTGTDANVLPADQRHPHDIVVSGFEGPLNIDNDNEIYSGPADGPTPPDPPDPTALPDNEWTHVAFTYSSLSFLRIYINGVKVTDSGTDLLQLNGVNTRAFQVGNRGDQSRDSWTGQIDDVYMFDHALTDEEILALIPPLPPATPGDFNDDGSVDAADYVLWRKNVDSTTALPNDDGLGTPIGSGHYDLWEENFGASGGGAGGGTSAAPEPGSAFLIAVGIASAMRIRRRGRLA
jgi:hypothetical protein